jgi:hypothetical protein
MSILAAIRREQKKVKKNLAKLQHQLSGLEAAAQALGNSTSRELKAVKNASCLLLQERRSGKLPRSDGRSFERRRRRWRDSPLAWAHHPALETTCPVIPTYQGLGLLLSTLALDLY